MADDGETKDDVKLPDGEIGDKITRLFTTEEKDTSKSPSLIPPFFFPLLSTLTLIPDVVILTAMGEQAAVEAKEAPRGA
jgi:translation initiation factor 5A